MQHVIAQKIMKDVTEIPEKGLPQVSPNIE